MEIDSETMTSVIKMIEEGRECASLQQCAADGDRELLERLFLSLAGGLAQSAASAPSSADRCAVQPGGGMMLAQADAPWSIP